MNLFTLLTNLSAPQKTAWTAFLVGTITFLYQLAEVCSRHSDWAEFRTPPTIGELLVVLATGLVAVAGALGIQFTFQKKE